MDGHDGSASGDGSIDSGHDVDWGINDFFSSESIHGFARIFNVARLSKC